MKTEDDCNTFMVTYRKRQEFEEDLHKHVHLENNILYIPEGGTAQAPAGLNQSLHATPLRTSPCGHGTGWFTYSQILSKTDCLPPPSPPKKSHLPKK